MIIKKGSKGQHVKDLQYKLKKVLNRSITIDGNFGKRTEQAVIDFQKVYNLYVDGLVGSITLKILNNAYKTLHVYNSKLLTFTKPRFVVFVDAGHGGINDKGEYVTLGKQSNHLSKELHEGSHYYEGYENRIVAEMFIEALTNLGIMTIRTYHPYKDTSLSKRTELIRSWLKRGYYGYLHSFHSNAIDSSNSKYKLETTQGFTVFSTRGTTLSDEIATVHFNNVKKYMKDWKFKTDTSDSDVDYEANFSILKHTDLEEFNNFGSILEEWGFHTSAADNELIINSRDERIKSAVDTAKWVKNKLKTLNNE